MTDKSGPHNPMEAARRGMRPELPKRFYSQATVGREGDLFAVLLDGKPVRTPAKLHLAVAEEAIATALAAEWQAQGERIVPLSMPLTRIVNVAIDRLAEGMAAVRADIVAYAGTDLLCYRADGPEGLVARQEAEWSPLVTWARQALDARFVLAEGIVHIRQSEAALAAIARALEPYEPLALAALHTITTLSGSAIVGLAVASGRLTGEAAWRAANVDEDWQASLWGEDALATERRANRRREMDAAALILDAGRPPLPWGEDSETSGEAG